MLFSYCRVDGEEVYSKNIVIFSDFKLIDWDVVWVVSNVWWFNFEKNI